MRTLIRLFNQTIDLQEQFEINTLQNIKNIESTYLDKLNHINNEKTNAQHTMTEHDRLQQPMSQIHKNSLTIF